MKYFRAYHSSLRGGLAFFVPYTINFFLMVLPILLIVSGSKIRIKFLIAC